jgi:hypothetical protein
MINANIKFICGRCGGTGVDAATLNGEGIPTSLSCVPCGGTGHMLGGILVFAPPLFYAYQVYNCVVPSEYDALSDAYKSAFLIICSMGIMDLTDGKNAKNTLWILFGEGTTTRANLAAMIVAGG